MVANEAYRFAQEHPDLKVVIGTGPDGEAMYAKVSDLLEEARMQTEMATQDAELFQVAAECWIGAGS